jgi:dihydropyrimidinase
VGVQGERIAVIGAPGSLPAEGRVIDATGKIVVPGGVEPHTHLAHFVGMFPDEQFYTLGPEEDSRGMVFGGTTTHVDFCFIRPNQLDLGAAIEQRASRWKGNSYNDYTFHVALAGASCPSARSIRFRRRSSRLIPASRSSPSTCCPSIPSGRPTGSTSGASAT